MPFPAEYQRATDHFYEFLHQIRDESGLTSAHQAYTMAQGVLQCFRRRLTLEQAIQFSNLLPVGLRALFVADWDPTQPRREFGSAAALLDEVRSLRPEHNFATDDAIQVVAKVLGEYVDKEKMLAFFDALPQSARLFCAWQG